MPRGFILADERTGKSLDEHTGAAVIELLVCAGNRHDAGLVHHNAEHAAKCSRQLVLREGRFA